MATPYVLVVDDEPILGEVLVRWMGALGYPARTVQNAQDALGAMESAVPMAVITDLLMPVRGGLWLVEAIRRQWPRMPIVISTGAVLDTEIVADELGRLSIAGILEKPFTREELVGVLQHAINPECLARTA